MSEFEREEAKEAVKLLVQAKTEEPETMYNGQGKAYMLMLIDWLYDFGFVLKEQ